MIVFILSILSRMGERQRLSVALHLFEVEPQIKETGVDRMNKMDRSRIDPVRPVKNG